jgi:hypothetical protein
MWGKRRYQSLDSHIQLREVAVGTKQGYDERRILVRTTWNRTRPR